MEAQGVIESHNEARFGDSISIPVDFETSRDSKNFSGLPQNLKYPTNSYDLK